MTDKLSRMKKQAARLILSLLQEKAIASDPDHAAAFDLSLWKTSDPSPRRIYNAASISRESKDTLRAEEGGFFYDSEMLAASFLEDSESLERQFSRFVWKLFSKNGTSSHKAGSCFSGGGHGGEHGGGSGKETAAHQETVSLPPGRN